MENNKFKINYSKGLYSIQGSKSKVIPNSCYKKE